MWDNAPLIPAMMTQVKGQVKHAAGERAGRGSYVKRVLRSVPCIGVQVGRFRSMERGATISFFDFVAGNVMILLIAF